MKVYQIYFKEEQFPTLEKEFRPYLNLDCTVFFESSVIRELIEEGKHKNSYYFGVVSYQLRQKLGFTKDNWKNNKNIANVSTQDFTVAQFTEQLYNGQPDAMSFQRHVPHDCIIVADGFHPGFKDHWIKIMKAIGYNWTPTEFQDVFYCNYFVARSDIYERYVREMLAPAMDVMLTMPELMNPCRYTKPLPEALQQKFGFAHWPFHAFIAERMFTYFAHIHNLKCLHY